MFGFLNIWVIVLVAYGFEYSGSLIAYSKGDLLNIKGGSLLSFTGPKYPFYGNQLTCRSKAASHVAMSEHYLGDIVAGTTLVEVPINIQVKNDAVCVPICTPLNKEVDSGTTYLGEHMIDSTVDLRSYPRLEVVIDNLVAPSKINIDDVPQGVKKYLVPEDGRALGPYYFHGVPLFDKRGALQNHWMINVEIEPTKSYSVEGGFLGIGGTPVSTTKYTIVGAHIEAESVINEDECKKSGDKLAYNRIIDHDASHKNWFYSVKFVENPSKTWSSRAHFAFSVIRCGVVLADGSCALADSQIPISWASLIDTGVLAFSLVVMESFIVISVLRKDFTADSSLEGGADDVVSWKSLKGDVFKKPSHSTILVTLVGAGLQIIFAFFPPFVAQIFGLVPDIAQGQIIQIGLISWALAGLPSGYLVCRIYRMFSSPNWKLTVIRTCLLVPGLTLLWVVVINLAIYISTYFVVSSAPLHMNVGGFARLMALWVFLSLPMTSIGCFLGLRSQQISFPVEPFRIPRPAQPVQWSHITLAAAAGSLVHAASMSLAESYLNGFIHPIFDSYTLTKLTIASVEWMVVASMSSVCLTFYLISDGCSNWWWWAYCAPASSGIWMTFILFAEVMNHTNSFSETLLYANLVGIGVVIFALVSAAVGFLSSLVFMFFVFNLIRKD